MSTAKTSKIVVLMAFMAAALSSVSMASMANNGLSYNFYNTSCPKAESTVRGVVQEIIGNDASMGAAFIRLFFHDCFVRVRETYNVYNANISL
jgi:peroxidase